ncbi:hypothetical protein H5410_030361 [Solanum commersonii]|uniref:Uncharacterized protein n=1 Tax=Solanum commersonii TaxID=4109 RepID=A0A9J5YGM5_SOLCO|nr:hypothetical protein H5410_030361 [Solanum commersonii]
MFSHEGTHLNPIRILELPLPLRIASSTKQQEQTVSVSKLIQKTKGKQRKGSNIRSRRNKGSMAKDMGQTQALVTKGTLPKARTSLARKERSRKRDRLSNNKIETNRDSTKRG